MRLRVRSMSVGDLVVDSNDTVHYVAPAGFAEVVFE